MSECRECARLRAELADLQRRYDAIAGVKAVHQWVTREYPRSGRCEHCGHTDRPTEYASIGHSYVRDRRQWLELCRYCHRKFDGHGAKVAATKRGKALSAEHRAALSIAKSKPRNPLTDAHRASISQSLMGHPGGHTAETRARMAEAHRGKTVSAEARAKIAAAAKARWADPAFRAKVKPAMEAGWKKRKGVMPTI